MGGSPDIWVRQVTGGELIRLTNDAANESTLTYAPDGQSIYYGSLGSIWRIGALGGNPRKVVEAATDPSVSADGKRLAYLHGETLEIANPDGTAPSKVVDALGWLGRAKLSPDGTRIALPAGIFSRWVNSSWSTLPAQTCVS
jgi:Tol biopolymer transport system component